MKKYIRIFALFLAVLSLMACTKDSGYRLIERDGKLYIYFEDTDTDDSQSGGSISAENLAVQFESFTEMRSDIMNGNFSEYEVATMKYHIRIDFKEQGELPVCDLEELYQLVYPEDLPKPIIYWDGPYYWQIIETHEAMIYAYHSSSYSTISFDRMTPDALAEFEISDIQEDEDRNSTAYYWTSRAGEHKTLFYELEKNGRSYMVREDFDLCDDDYVEGVPSYIRIYFEDGEHTAMIHVNNRFDRMKERPSVEWLTSFDFYEYVAE